MSKVTRKPGSPKNAPADLDAEPMEAIDVATSGALSGEDAPTPAPQVPKRAYKGTQEVDHDLFKLTVSKMLKNVSWTDEADVVKFEHCHMFHTVDSNGKRLDVSSAIGGHVHEVKVIPQGEGKTPLLQIGPARKWVIKKMRGGGRQKVLVPVEIGLDHNEQPIIDDHTHGAEYLGSERVKLREASVEAAKYESAVRAQREPVVEGVISR